MGRSTSGIDHVAAAALMGVVSTVFAVYAVVVLVTAGDGGLVASRDAVGLGISGREEGMATSASSSWCRR